MNSVSPQLDIAVGNAGSVSALLIQGAIPNPFMVLVLSYNWRPVQVRLPLRQRLTEAMTACGAKRT
jgi:hypothetical protein